MRHGSAKKKEQEKKHAAKLAITSVGKKREQKILQDCRL
jgi:hypothetical protein